MNDTTIRPAAIEDAAAMLAIYGEYVRNTAITFEYEVPTLDAFRDRVAKTLTRYPWLAAERGGQVLGYAYAGPLGERAAFGWSCEASIYLAPEARGQGIGRRLYGALEDVLRAMGVQNLYARVAFPGVEDEYLTRNSVDFHAHVGYREVGHLHRCGHKFGRWYDLVYMEKRLGATEGPAAPIIPFPEIRRILFTHPSP